MNNHPDSEILVFKTHAKLAPLSRIDFLDSLCGSFFIHKNIFVITETYSKVEMVLTDEDLVNIQKLKSLMSHINPNMSHADLYKELVHRTLKQLDPEQKPQRKSAPAPKVEPKERNTEQLNKSQKIGQLRVMSRHELDRSS